MAGFGLGNYLSPQVGGFIDSRRNALAGLGAGLLNGQPGAGVQAGLQADDAYATQQKAEAERQKAIADQQALRSKYADWFTQQGQPQIAQGIADGIVEPGQAYWDFINPPKADPVKGIEINGQLVNPLTGEPMGDFRTPETAKQPAPPSGYQWTPEGTQTFIPGGPADPATAGKTTEATRRNQQLAKVIIPEAESLLGGNGKPGTFDALTNVWSQGVDAMGPLGLVVGGGPSGEYQQAKNSLKTIIASYLYSVSGATANPGEVETQASVLTPRPGEPKSSLDDKKKRIATMVQAVIDAAKGTPIDVGAGQQPAGNYKVLSVEP